MTSALMKKKVRDVDGGEKVDTGKRLIDDDNENGKKRAKPSESIQSNKESTDKESAKDGTKASNVFSPNIPKSDEPSLKSQGTDLFASTKEATVLQDNLDVGSGREVQAGDIASLETGYMSFPEKIMMLLNKTIAIDAMWWLSDGDAFCILPIPFTEKVLDKHFQGTKFESFTRKLNRWGFKRVAGEGIPSNAIAFYHNLFHKDKPELLKEMSGGKTRSPIESREKGLVDYGKIDNTISEMLASNQLGRERDLQDAERRFGGSSQRQSILEASSSQDILNWAARDALLSGSDSNDGRHQAHHTPQLTALLAQQMGMNSLTSEAILRNQLSGRNLSQLQSDPLSAASHSRSSELDYLLSSPDAARILALQRENLHQSSLSADSTRLLLHQLGGLNQRGSTDVTARLLAQRAGAGSLYGNAMDSATLLDQLGGSQLGSDADATLHLLMAQQRGQSDLMSNSVASALLRQQIGASESANPSVSYLQSRILAERLQSAESRDSSELLNRLLLQQMGASQPSDSLDLRTRLLMNAAGSGRGLQSTLGEQSLTDQQLYDLYMLEQQRDLRARLGM